MSESKFQVIPGGKIETPEVPERIEFPCFHCARSCLVWPRSQPIAVQHSLPTCSEWKKSEASITIGGPPLFMEQFLEKSGVQLLKPERLK